MSAVFPARFPLHGWSRRRMRRADLGAVEALRVAAVAKQQAEAVRREANRDRLARMRLDGQPLPGLRHEKNPVPKKLRRAQRRTA